MKSNGGNILNYLVKANQLGLSSTDATICNFSSFQCKQRDLQPRTLCGVVKPICPVLKFSCRLCNFYLSSKSCRKTCQTFEKYCGSSECSSSSISIPTEPSTEITGNSKSKIETLFFKYSTNYNSFKSIKEQLQPYPFLFRPWSSKHSTFSTKSFHILFLDRILLT